MTTTSADANLVTAYLAGDRNALAALYDRFAPSLYDTAAAMLSDRDEAADVVQDTFLVAAQRMGQLRDPERIKAWLFAIARHEIYRRTKRRRRMSPSEAVPDVAAPTDIAAEAEMVSYAELAALVRDATSGLDERDQLVLELSVRQGLQGADLAAALGVTPEQSYTLVHRMRERVERTMGALIVARQGRKECRELEQVLLGWDGTFSVLWRKRVARHVDACETCERSRRKLAPLALFGAAPAFALPPALRERVLSHAGATAGSPPSNGYPFKASGGFPGRHRIGRRAMLLVGGTIAILLALVAGIAVAEKIEDPGTEVEAAGGITSSLAETTAPETTALQTTTAPATTPAPAVPEPTVPASTIPETTVPETTVPATTVPPPTTAPPTTPPTTAPPTAPAPPGKLELSSTVIDLGRSTTSAVLTLTNVGGRSFDWTRGTASPFGVSGPTGGRLKAGQSAQLTVSIDRANLSEGSYSEALAIGGDFPSAVQLKARVERRPVVDITSIEDANAKTCISSLVTVRADVADESAITSVKGTWTGPAGTGTFTLTFNGQWTGSIAMSGGWGQGNGGTYALTVTATDSRGNAGSETGKFFVETCPG